MLCCVCKQKEATVHLTQIEGEKVHKVDLCEDCAKQKGVNDPTGFALADLLLGIGAAQDFEQAGGGKELRYFIDQALDMGVKFYVCQPSLDLHGYTLADLIEDVQMIGGAAFNDLCSDADAVISF